MAQGRYQFEGQQIESPSGGVNVGNMGSVVSDLLSLEAQGLNSRWQVEDETIQLDLLKGAPVQSLFDRYMNLSQQAAAVGNELASVTFQQKAYMLMEQAKRGSGGGGGDGSSSKKAAAAAEAGFQEDWEKLVKERAAEFDAENRELFKGAITGFVKTKDGEYIDITAPEAIDSILKNMEAYQQEVVEIANKYGDFLYGKDGGPVTGWADVKKAIDDELGLAIKGSKAGQGIKMFDAFFNDVLGEEGKSDVSPLNKFYDKVYSRVIAGYDEAGNPIESEEFALTYIPPETDRTGLSKGNTGLFNYQWVSKEEAQAAGYVPVRVLLDDGRTRTEYHRPGNYDDFASGIDAFTQFQVPQFDKDGKFKGYNALSFMDGKWYNSANPTQEGAIEASIDEEGIPTLFANEDARKFNESKITQEMKARSRFGFSDQFGKREESLGRNVMDAFGIDQSLFNRMPERNDSIRPEDTFPGASIASPEDLQPNLNVDPVQALIDRMKPKVIPENPFAGAKSGVQGSVVQPDNFAEILKQRFGTPKPGTRAGGGVVEAAPRVPERTAAPLRNFKTGVGGSVREVAPEKSRRFNPLDVRRQASEAAMQGYRAFQNLFKKFKSFF